MAGGGHVLAQRHADRRQGDRAARDTAAVELQHNPGGDDPLTTSAPRIALPPTIDAAALAGHDPAAPIRDLAGETMGTSWRVLFAGRQDAAAIRAAIVARLAGLVAQLSHWEPASALSRFNDASAGSWTRLPPDLARVMDEGWRIAAATGGAFDPAIGALVDLWGFGPPGPRRGPSDDEVRDALTRRRRLIWRPADRLLYQPGGVRLDLSGIAKGYAVDAVAELLAKHGIRHCLIEIGGELRGHGLRPDGDPWWVELEEPEASDRPPLRVALHGLSVATSGTYRRGDHNLDPRTGRAPTNGVAAASAIAATAIRADALASAALVAYPHLAPAGLLDVPLRLVVRRGAKTEEIVTAPLAAMLSDAVMTPN